LKVSEDDRLSIQERDYFSLECYDTGISYSLGSTAISLLLSSGELRNAVKQRTQLQSSGISFKNQKLDTA
jgi:hypothetical protein